MQIRRVNEWPYNGNDAEEYVIERGNMKFKFQVASFFFKTRVKPMG